MGDTKRGRFIALEGIDGSGKSTQLKYLAERFAKEELPFYGTMEPTSSPFGKLMRQVLRGEVKTDPRVAAPLFVADRLDHLLGETDGIVKKLENGIHVVTDRYYFSSYAYQGVDLGLDWVIEANAPCAGILRPDLTLFIDIDPDTAMERIRRNRDVVEIFEKKERLVRTRALYLEAFERLKDVERVEIVDGNRPVEEIAEDLWQRISALL